VTLLSFPLFGRQGFGPSFLGGGLRILFLAFLLASVGVPFSAAAQEDSPRTLLRDEYEIADLDYQSAFRALEVQETRFTEASQRLNNAIDSGDDAAANVAYGDILRIRGERLQAQRRVEETAESLRETKRRLLEATALYLEELLSQADTATNPVAQRDIAGLIPDIRNQIATLQNAVDPPVTVEPLPEMNVERRDGPTELRAKAGILEFAANQYEEQHAYFQGQLEDLRRDQSLLRRSRDFLDGVGRFDDTRVPVGPPETRSDRPPETFEEKIQALETLQEEITRWIQNIRVRAADLRRLAGGQWA